MAEDGEVVDGDDDRRSAPQRAAIRRAVEDVDPRATGGARQADRVPRELARKRGGGVVAAEAEADDLDVGATVELPQERLQVPRRAGPRLRERRDVDADPHGTRVCQRAQQASA